MDALQTVPSCSVAITGCLFLKRKKPMYLGGVDCRGLSQEQMGKNGDISGAHQ